MPTKYGHSSDAAWSRVKLSLATIVANCPPSAAFSTQRVFLPILRNRSRGVNGSSRDSRLGVACRHGRAEGATAVPPLHRARRADRRAPTDRRGANETNCRANKANCRVAGVSEPELLQMIQAVNRIGDALLDISHALFEWWHRVRRPEDRGNVPGFLCGRTPALDLRALARNRADQPRPRARHAARGPSAEENASPNAVPLLSRHRSPVASHLF